MNEFLTYLEPWSNAKERLRVLAFLSEVSKAIEATSDERRMAAYLPIYHVTSDTVITIGRN